MTKKQILMLTALAAILSSVIILVLLVLGRMPPHSVLYIGSIGTLGIFAWAILKSDSE
jgi:hypothetical protein